MIVRLRIAVREPRGLGVLAAAELRNGQEDSAAAARVDHVVRLGDPLQRQHFCDGDGKCALEGRGGQVLDRSELRRLGPVDLECLSHRTVIDVDG